MRKNDYTIYNVFDDLFAGLDPFNPFKVFENIYKLDQVPRQIRELSASSFPPANVYVTKGKELIIEVAMAGVKPEQVKLDLEGRTLVLDIDKSIKEGDTDPKEGWYKLQGGIKDFTQVRTTYTIPRQYDLGRIEANVKDGMLTVKVQPTEETKRLDEKRQIAITSGE